MGANTILLTLACSAMAHLVMTCVMALYARHRVQYLSLAWINGIFSAILIGSAVCSGMIPDGQPGILNPLMMIMLVVGCFLQSIYPLSIPMPGYLQWGRMWKYASPAIVLIVIYLLAFLVGENMEEFQTFADVRANLFSLSMLLRIAAILLALFYIFNIFMLPRFMVRHPEVPRYLLGYCTVLGLSAVFYLVVAIVYDATLLMIYVILFTLLNMYLCLRALETMAVSLPQPVIEEVEEEVTLEAETEVQEEAKREDFNEANLQRFHRLESWMQRNPMAWKESTFGRDQLCREVGLNRHLVLQSVRSQGYNNVHDYINRYRIEELKRMILRGEVATVGESVDAGFGTVATARSCFKKMEGIRLDDYMALRGAKTRVKSLN
ncbi:MAG: hypothetical protein IJR87_02320 [Bacteroidaceae bacterium]|nr:hypothetical protein [Bacteroidaceae bacterium]